MVQTYVYKKENNCEIKGDSYTVKSNNSPLIIYIHGGGLVWGTRNDIFKKHIQIYNNAGFNVFSIDYRLAPETKLPNIIADIEDAIKWIKEESSILFDRNKVAVIGSSAGGYLALNSGLFKQKPNVIVSFYGYGNIINDWYLSPSDYYLKKMIVPEMLAKQLVQGEQISEAPIEKRYAIYLYCRQQGRWLDYILDEDMIANKKDLNKYCPIKHVNNDYPPTLLLHGDQDEDVPYEESLQFADKLKEANVSHKLITIEGGKHDFDRQMSDNEAAKVINDVIQFLNNHL